MPRPLNAGKRYIVLEPVIMENADVDVWVNDKKQLKVDLDDKQRQLFKYTCFSDFNDILRVKIHVKKGKVVLDYKSGVGIYPVVYNNEPGEEMIEGLMKFKQYNHVAWLQNPSLEVNSGDSIIIEEGQTFEYLHLVPNGPEWFDVFFNREKDRIKFTETRNLSDKMIDYALFDFKAEYFMKDADVSIEERTKNLLEKFYNV